MLDLNRRAVKVISGSLAAVMLNFAVLPAAAFAAHHHHQPPRHYQSSYRQVRYYQPLYYRPYYYKPRYHHRYHDTWTKRDTATVAGLAAVIGLLALANRKHRENIAPAEPVNYATYNNQAGSNVAYADFAVEVLRLVNVERAKVGAAPLRLSNDLMDVAAIRAEEITRSFSHQRPDGSSCFTLVRNQNRTMGENIAAGSATPEAVVDQWMHSSGHRANMLNKDFKELGVGHCYKEGSSYGHYWIQMFRG